MNGDAIVPRRIDNKEGLQMGRWTSICHALVLFLGLAFPALAYAADEAGHFQGPTAQAIVGEEQTADPSKAIPLPNQPAELAQRLVELSRARFDLQYKTFGVQEFLDKLDLAHRLKMAAARLAGDEKAQLAAAQDLQRQLEQVSAAMETRCRGTTAPIVDRELARYRAQQAAALVAKHDADTTAEIDCCRKAVAAAGELRRALTLAYEAGVLPSTDMLRLSWHPCEARIALIDLTMPEPEEAKRARTVALEELLQLADKACDAKRSAYMAGLSPFVELYAVLGERSRIAMHLAREQGNRDEELKAAGQMIQADRSRLERLHELHERNVGLLAFDELEKAMMQLKVHEAEYLLIQHRHEAETASGEAARHLQIDAANATLHRRQHDLHEAHQTLLRLKHLHGEGGCYALAVVEAAVRERLVRILLQQGQLELAKLQQEQDAGADSRSPPTWP